MHSWEHTDGPNFVGALACILREIHDAILLRTPAVAYLHVRAAHYGRIFRNICQQESLVTETIAHQQTRTGRRRHRCQERGGIMR
jgi:hypothetical protein